MVGMEQKLLVPFGAENGAVHDARFEIQTPAPRRVTRSQAA